MPEQLDIMLKIYGATPPEMENMAAQSKRASCHQEALCEETDIFLLAYGVGVAVGNVGVAVAVGSEAGVAVDVAVAVGVAVAGGGPTGAVP